MSNEHKLPLYAKVEETKVCVGGSKASGTNVKVVIYSLDYL